MGIAREVLEAAIDYYLDGSNAAWLAKAAVLRSRGRGNTVHDINQAADYLESAAAITQFAAKCEGCDGYNCDDGCAYPSPVRPVEKFTIGKETEERVFKANGITDLSNLQAVLDAVEAALNGQWHEIDDAPKDGSKFMFIEDGGRIQVGRMDSEWGEPNRVYVCLTGASQDWYPSINPRYWMKLPSPPKGMKG